MRVIYGLVLGVVMVGSVAANELPRPPDSNRTSKEHGHCVLMSQMLYRLAELRDAGVPGSEAAGRVHEWAARLGQTGSHLKAELPVSSVLAQTRRGERRAVEVCVRDDAGRRQAPLG